MIVRLISAAVLAAFCAACSLSALDHDPEAVFGDPAAYAVSDKVIQAVKSRDTDAFVRLGHPDIGAMDDGRQQVEQVYAFLPDEAEYEITRFYAERRQGQGEYAGVPIYLTMYDVVSPTKTAELTLAVAEQDGVCCVTTYWRIIPTSGRPSAFHDLTFEAKGWLHYLVFGLLILVPLFILFTAVQCGRNKFVSRKWAWIPFILLGFWGLSFNWTTGALQSAFFHNADGMFYFELIKLNLLGAGITTRGIFQPWIIEIGIPIGAVLYWVWPARAARKRKAQAGTLPSYAVGSEHQGPEPL
tara:strand:+ start:118 stop:1014 length:897 start_codon:yes stop_codon:yes gene_type:complete